MLTRASMAAACVVCCGVLSTGEPRLLDIARANLGIVRGALQLGGYRAMAWSDLPALLAWKCGQQRPL